VVVALQLPLPNHDSACSPAHTACWLPCF
jgi:hypothetical protein